MVLSLELKPVSQLSSRMKKTLYIGSATVFVMILLTSWFYCFIGASLSWNTRATASVDAFLHGQFCQSARYLRESAILLAAQGIRGKAILTSDFTTRRRDAFPLFFWVLQVHEDIYGPEAIETATAVFDLAEYYEYHNLRMSIVQRERGLKIWAASGRSKEGYSWWLEYTNRLKQRYENEAFHAAARAVVLKHFGKATETQDDKLVSLQFTIKKTGGTASAVSLVNRTGNTDQDMRVLEIARTINNFPALPRWFKGDVMVSTVNLTSTPPVSR